MVKVCERANNASGCLEKPPLVIGRDVEERPVWGIDSYTRKMIELTLAEVPAKFRMDADDVTKFIERVRTCTMCVYVRMDIFII